MKYVKNVLNNAKDVHTRKSANTKFLLKHTGLTNAGAMGLKKITKHIVANNPYNSDYAKSICKK